MTRAKRYTLVIAGVIIFFIAAPVLIYGIRGYTYDFDNNRLVKTGILVVRTEPKEVLITVSGGGKTRVQHKAGTMRFLTPADYDITIEKEGYHTWSKRLTVRGGLVTWANEGREKIYLLPKSPKVVSETSVYTPKIDEQNYTYELRRSSDKPDLGELVRTSKFSPNDRTVLLTDIPYRQDATVISGSNGLVFIILDRVLYQVGNGLEYVADGVDFAKWDRNIEKLVYGNAHEINFFNPFDAGSGQKELLTRTSESGGSFCVIPVLGYALRSYGNEIRAIELDGRGKRNIYNLLKNENALFESEPQSRGPEIMECDKEGEKIVVKAGSVFRTYSLR